LLNAIAARPHPVRSVTRARVSRIEPLEPRRLLSGSLTGLVFDDINADGGRAPGDAPLPNQPVQLWRHNNDGTSTDLGTTLTGPDGRYLFPDLADGFYQVRWVPNGDRFDTRYWVDPTRSVSVPDTVSGPGQPLEGLLDFSTALHASLSGVAFRDLNRNGARDPDEPPMAGLLAFIDQENDGVFRPWFPSSTTDANGAYQIGNLRPGEYAQHLRLQLPPGFIPTAPTPFQYPLQLHSGDVLTGNDFGLAPELAVAGLTLINSNTDRPIGPLTNGMTIDLAEVGKRLNVRADLPANVTRTDVRSVRFNYDGNPGYRIENGAPFALGGDTAGDYASWTPRLGTHTLVVTPYGSSGAAGEQGRSDAINFTVIDTTPAPAHALRVNAGGPAYTTGAGASFASDRGFDNSVARFNTFPVAGTTDDRLYSSYRFGRRMRFRAAADNGTYALRLHFAEPLYPRAGRRVFDVFAEGRRILDHFDVAAAAGGPRTAVVKQSTVTISDGRLDLSFNSWRDNAIVSAIELVPAVQSPAEPAPFFVDAGAPAPTTDVKGRVYDRDRTGAYGFTGGTPSADVFDVTGYDPDNLGPWVVEDSAQWATHRFGPAFSFNRPVANGHYAVFLGFAEPDANAVPGTRTFDVFAEGVQVLDDYDIVKDIRFARREVAREFDVAVTDGSLDLSFRGVTGDAVVSYIAAIPTDVPKVALPYSAEGESDAAREARAARNLSEIAFAIGLYMNEHKGHFPPDLKTLSAYEVDDVARFADPRAGTRLPRGALADAEKRAWVAAHDDYIYLGAGKRFSDMTSTVPFAYENPRRVPGAIYVLFGDQHVERMERAAAAALLGFDPAPPAVTPTFPDPSSPAFRKDPAVVASAANLRTIGQALFRYSNYNRGTFPRDFGRLYETQQFEPDPLALATFINPRGDTLLPTGLTEEEKIAWAARSTDYTYVCARRRYALGGDDVLAYENPAELKGGINLLFADGRVEFRELRWAIDTIQASLARSPQ
jgi:prepilin-type processing-associated H-X9-DG protein